MFWQQINELDQEVTLAINSCHSPFTDPIWAFFSDKYVWIPMYVAILGLIIWKLGWKKSLFVIGAIALAFGVGDQISNIVKLSVERIRPLHDETMQFLGLHVLEQGGGFSFYSAHAANSFALAFCSYIGLKKGLGDKSGARWLKIYAVWMFFWAFMVSISRVFVGKHYLGDVTVGILAGCLVGIFFGWLAGRFMKINPCTNTLS